MPGPRYFVKVCKKYLERIRDGDDPTAVFLDVLSQSEVTFKQIVENLNRIAAGLPHPAQKNRIPDERTQHMAARTVLEAAKILASKSEGGKHLHLHGGELDAKAVKALLKDPVVKEEQNGPEEG